MIRSLGIALFFSSLLPVTVSAQSPEDLANACIDDDPAGLAAASLALQQLTVEDFADVARRHPRAVELSALIALRNGRLDDAARIYGAIIEHLAGAKETRERFVRALDRLSDQRMLAATGASRFATSGFTLSGTVGSFTGRDGGRLTAAAWVKTRCGHALSPDQASLEIIQVSDSGQMTPLHVVRSSWLALESNFLLVNGPGRDPIIVVRDFRAGGCTGCNRVRLFSIGPQAATEIALPSEASGVITRLADLDGDGLAEALALDTRWVAWRGLCQACSPTVVAIYRLEEGRLVEACTDFPNFYAEQVQYLEAHLPTRFSVDHTNVPVISIILNLAQAGRFASALAYLGAAQDGSNFASEADREWAAVAFTMLEDRLRVAQAGGPGRCPVNGMTIVP